jgi:hypothetical protein
MPPIFRVVLHETFLSSEICTSHTATIAGLHLLHRTAGVDVPEAIEIIFLWLPQAVGWQT